MKYIKKGNKIVIAKDDDNVVGSLEIETRYRVNTQDETIRFINSDVAIDFVTLTSITDENGVVRLKADFPTFQSFVNYFANSVFFLNSQDQRNKGTYDDPVALQTAFPVGQIGWTAYVVSTGTYWFWNETDWEDSNSSASPGVNFFNGRQGNVEPEIGDYSYDMVTGSAPLDSPIFTGSPTAPTPLISDNSTKIATTEFVKNLLNSLTPVTVGAGGQYADFTEAYNAGFSWFYAIGDFAQTSQFLFSRTVRITIANNINVTFSNVLSNPVRHNGVVENNFILDAEGNGKITWNPTSGAGIPFLSSENVGLLNFIKGNINLDFSGSTSGTYLISQLSRIKDYYGYGITNISLPNVGASGFSYTSGSVSGKIEENSLLAIKGGGSTCAKVLEVTSNNNFVFFGEIKLYGTFSTSDDLLNITNNKAVVGAITFKPDSAQTGNMKLSGLLNALNNTDSNNINISIGASDSSIYNADLGATGVFNVGSFANIKMFNVKASSVANTVSSTVFTACFFGAKLNSKIADYVSWSWAISRSGFSANILNSPTPQNFFQYFMNGTTPPTPTLSVNDMQLKLVDFVFDATNPLSPVLIFPAVDGEVEYTMRISITGTYSGATGTVRVLPFDIQRVSDGSLLGSSKHIKDLNTNTITAEFVELTTRTIGLTDNFSLTGIRFPIIQNTGATLTITNIQFYLSARVIKLN